MQRSRGGQATWQDADFEQRIYQAHPSRRAAAEPCMQLHPTKYGCGELQPPVAAALQPPVAAALSPASPAALEAAWRICTRRDALARFLLRKEHEEAHGAAAPPQRHPKAGGRQYAVDTVEYVAPTPEALRAVDAQLLALAALLAGLRECSVDSDGAEDEAGAEGEQSESRSRVLLQVAKCTKIEAAVARLGGLVGTPRDMSSAAAAELRAALQLMSVQ